MESLSKADQERMRVANMPLSDYLSEWVELHRANVSILTYQGYKNGDGTQQNDAVLRLSGAVREGCDGR